MTDRDRVAAPLTPAELDAAAQRLSQVPQLDAALVQAAAPQLAPMPAGERALIASANALLSRNAAQMYAGQPTPPLTPENGRDLHRAASLLWQTASCRHNAGQPQDAIAYYRSAAVCWRRLDQEPRPNPFPAWQEYAAMATNAAADLGQDLTPDHSAGRQAQPDTVRHYAPARLQPRQQPQTGRTMANIDPAPFDEPATGQCQPVPAAIIQQPTSAELTLASRYLRQLPNLGAYLLLQMYPEHGVMHSEDAALCAAVAGDLASAGSALDANPDAWLKPLASLCNAQHDQAVTILRCAAYHADQADDQPLAIQYYRSAVIIRRRMYPGPDAAETRNRIEHAESMARQLGWNAASALRRQRPG